MKVSNYRTILDAEALNSYGSGFLNRLSSGITGALSRRGGKHKKSKKHRKHRQHRKYNKSRKY